METIVKRLLCPLCSSDKASKFAKWDHREIVKCRVCSFVYASHYDNAVLESVYKNSYYDSASDPRIKAWIDRFKKTWQGLVEDLLSTKPQINSLLDIGAGTGGFLIYFQEASPQTKLSAIESSGHARSHLESQIKNLEVPVDSAEELSQVKAKYDAVVLLQCLEHVHAPLELCKNIYQLMNDDGVFFLTVPNRKSFQNWFKTKLEIKCYANKTHLQFFSHDTLEEMLKKAGFKTIQRISRFGGTEISGVNALFQFALRKMGKSTELRYIVKK